MLSHLKTVGILNTPDSIQDEVEADLKWWVTLATLAKEQVQGIGSVFLNSVLQVYPGFCEWRIHVGRNRIQSLYPLMTQLGFLQEEGSEALI